MPDIFFASILNPNQDLTKKKSGRASKVVTERRHRHRRRRRRRRDAV